MAHMKNRVLILLLLGTLVVLGFVLAKLVNQSKPWNVILITVDTLRADHLGVYGYAKNTSPNLDRFAKESLLFRRAYAHYPATVPSVSCLMTSHYAHETKALTNDYILPPEAVTLAEILKANGYRTGAVASNTALLNDAGLNQGFDDYDDDLEEKTVLGLERNAEQTTRKAMAWLERHHQEKFFLWIHYMDPHGPYTPPAPYDTMFVDGRMPVGAALPVNKGVDGKGGIPEYQVLGEHRDPAFYIAQYDGEVRYFDHWFGELLQALGKYGLWENSLLVFTADHGEGLGEHDYYFDHTDFLYDELLHVPLILRLPGPSAEGRALHESVGQIEILPEILRSLSIRSSEKFEDTGLLAGVTDKPIFAETFYGSPQFSLFTPDLKIIRSQSGYEIYDLQNDRREVTSLTDGALEGVLREKVSRLKERLDSLRAQDRLGLGAPRVRLLAEMLHDRMKALGYVQ